MVTKCKNCGKVLVVKHRTYYCSDECRKSSQKYERRSTRADLNERKKVEKIMTKYKSKSIAEINAEALAHGMSYGKYVGMKGI